MWSICVYNYLWCSCRLCRTRRCPGRQCATSVLLSDM